MLSMARLSFCVRAHRLHAAQNSMRADRKPTANAVLIEMRGLNFDRRLHAEVLHSN